MIFLHNGPKLFQRFQSRLQAGQILAQELRDLNLEGSILICAIPRGGVVVGAQICKELAVPLTVIPVKKIAAPSNPELAIGAVGPWGKPIFDKPLISALQIQKDLLAKIVKEAKNEVKRREMEFGVQKTKYSGRTVILTDDGIATGSTIILAARLIRTFNPRKLILAVPVAPSGKLPQLKRLFDEVIVLLTPGDFHAVGQFYYDFPQVTDEEVIRLLRELENWKQ